MRMAAFVAYYRVSTQAQGRSGLGLDAQRDAVARHLASVGGHLAESFEEVESGKVNTRPALAASRAHKATLLVAKLDQVARNARFLPTVVEGSGEGRVCFCDLPQIPPGATGKFILTLFAAVAELEAGLISARTKAELAQAKARGIKLGNPRLRAGHLAPVSERERAARAGRAAAI
jgi:DNA invertase Pin-like site-specific DNA recombinase